MLDEFGRIAWLKSRFELDGRVSGAVIGIGDDAAVIDFGNRPAVVTVDAQVERVHFRTDFISHRDLGYRAVVAAVSDIWAMAALPNASVVALNLPDGLEDESFRELIEGLADAARLTGARVVGGNLSGGRDLAITTTAFGLPVAQPLSRQGARPGDSVYVTGTLGAAALGLAVLQARRLDLEHAPAFAERWRRPPINGYAAKVLAEIATAAIDVSDGCLQDLGHLCTASEVGATLFADAVPMSPGHQPTCESLGLNALELAFCGGEDYELLFTAQPCPEALAIARRIGEITEDGRIEVIDGDGRALHFDRSGYRHFA